jgi:exonuclease SbcC
MSDHVYLTGINLTQYRSFAKLNVVLPDSPGVLIVHGSNGIGKSSLFDALEWTLTDQIDHFRKVKGAEKAATYLCRWRDGAPGPTTAELIFSRTQTISRTLSSKDAKASTLGGTIKDVTAFLRAPDWRQNISALSKYLLLTHFLGQSTLSRFTNRDPSERFDILKEAAQTDQIEAIGVTLHGKGNTSAVRAFNKRVETLEQETQRLSDLLETEAQLWNGLDETGSLDEAAADAMAVRTASLISGLDKDASLPALPGVKDLETSVETIRQSQRRRQSSLERARSLIDDWGRSASAMAELDAGTSAVALQIFNIQTQHAETVALIAKLREAAERDHAALGAARVRQTALVGLRDLVVSLEASERTASLAKERLEAAQREAGERGSEVERLDLRFALVRRIEGAIGRLDERLGLAQTEIDRVERWIDREDAVEQIKRSLSEIEAASPDIDDTIAAAETSLALAQVTVGQRSQMLELLRGTVSTISAAVATIAAHLPDDLCDCPVCATRFEQKGELQDRASHAAERLAPLVLDQEEQLRAATTSRDELKADLERHTATRNQIADLRRDVRRESDANQQLIASLFEAGDASLEAARDRLDRLMTDLGVMSRLRQRKWVWRNRVSGDIFEGGGPYAALVRQRDTAASELTAATTNNTTAAERVADATQRLAERDRAIGSAAVLRGPDLEREIEAAGAAVAELEQTAAGSNASLQNEVDRLSGIELSQVSATARQTEIVEQLRSATTQRDNLLSDWKVLGYGTDETPTDGALLQEIEALSTQEAALVQVEDLIKQLKDGRSALTLKQNHTAAVEQLRTAVSGAPNSGRDQLRREMEELRSNKLRLAEATREAKAIARATSDDIATEAANFNSAYITPLAKLMSQINRAILCDRRVGMGLNVENRKIEQSASKEGVVPENIGSIDPILVHSEGQMAALSVSLLCAASLTYPWSRWRGIVLDDPLQHNDAIHSAAFADFVCNLVATRGYQVLLSTHDRAQAEFLQRKISSRHLSCSVLTLLGEGEEGVQTSFRSAAPQLPTAVSA